MKNNFWIAILTFLLLVVNSCNSNKSIPVYMKFFNEKEKQELTIITTLWNNLLTNSFNTQDTNLAFQRYLYYVDESDGAKMLIRRIYDRFERNDLNRTLDSIKELDIFKKIWKANKMRYNGNEKDSITILMGFNQDGVYYRYLKKLYDKNQKKYFYWDALETAGGGIMPANLEGGFQKTAYNNLSDENFKIIITIHYITLLLNYYDRDS